MQLGKDSNGRFVKGHTLTPLGHTRALGYKHTEEAKKQMSEYALSIGRIPKSQKGVVRSDEQKIKISISRKGKYSGEDNDKWKGDNVGYCALHGWVRRHLGHPKKCIFCGSEKNVQWANKSLQYKRDLDDWLELCHKCHYAYDHKNGWGVATKKFPSISRRVNAVS